MRKLVALLEEVDDCEQDDPNYVNEVPVVGGHDRASDLVVAEVLGQQSTANDEQEGNQTAGHVQCVEPGGDVERGTIRIGRDSDAVRDQDSVFVGLNSYEDGAHNEGQYVPLDHAPLGDLEDATAAEWLVVVFGREYTELDGDGTSDKDGGVNEREGNVKRLGLLSPQITRACTQGEIHSEEAGEEHQLAR